jgi:pimeloyl-ACP methyl ester carboxylesterase
MSRTPPRKLVVDGAELHYIERGEGDPLVFVHGGLSDLRTWGPQLRPFSERYRVVAYSRRGYYPNAFPADYTQSDMMRHVADLAALIDHLGLERVYLVANSYGSYISLVYALHHPERVRAMALAEPPIHPLLRRLPGGEELFEEFMREAWRPARVAFERGEMEEGVRLFVEGAVGPGEWERLPERVREAMLPNGPEMAAAARTPIEVQMVDVTCEDAARIEAPTLLLYGAKSPPKYRLINDELCRCMPHAERAVIPDAAHVLHSQNPEEHNRVVLDFLERHKRG